MTVNALVLTGFGINCDNETERALARAGADAVRIHLNDLLEHLELMDKAHILAIPGGFSFGDHVASGKIIANRLRHKLGEPLQRFIGNGKLVIGICNGFQVMVKLGLLPLFDGAFKQETTLAWNDSCRFENRWVYLRAPQGNRCVWLKDIELLELPVRHGEGKFIPGNDEVLRRLQDNGQIAFQYAREDGAPANGEFPFNPNGATADIAGICDPSGRIFGLMPHPEGFQERENHPNWTRLPLPDEGAGLKVFRNAVEFARNEL
ncbi:MAG TPA: phosphoribosylformylglycinamidine synthase subunit PurQ [Candidatus Hydrogenedentes bacterium]|nr:phosphoribosylformylglycinamidine synthase subunit PurQ [Candidatus Hydrogenedentota bacterium]